MPRIEDHPLVLARLYAGISRSALAAELGVNRSTIAAIEEGRTQHPTAETMLQIDRALKLRPGTLATRMSTWRGQQAQAAPSLTLKARAVLSRGPAEVARYSSFQAWRQEIAPTRSAFASMLGMNHTTVSRYEDGVRVGGMPDTLASALLSRLQISPEYLLALKKLPPRSN